MRYPLILFPPIAGRDALDAWRLAVMLSPAIQYSNLSYSNPIPVQSAD